MATFSEYLEALRHPFIKIARLRFLNPDGSTAFAVDNDPMNRNSGCFIADGQLRVNLQNGQRRSATVKLARMDETFDYDVNHRWFGQEIALDEGLVLPNGEEYYIQQGVFLIDTPQEVLSPEERTVTYNLTDKWANLDGTLYGNLEGTYEIGTGTNIFQPVAELLEEDRGNGEPVDRTTPTFTTYYDGMAQDLPDGTTVPVTDTPYTLRIDSDSGTLADVILGLMGMINAWVGYDATGSLRVDPSQDDILDKDKPLGWRFLVDDVAFLGATYTIKNTEVFNDYIAVGEQMDDYTQPKGRAANYDPRSDTNVMTIGRKTKREQKTGYATDRQCQDYAEWMLKRVSVLQKAVSISCGQIFHIMENELVEIVRTDKENSPVERHLIMGFSRPIAGTGEMTIDAVSVNDMVMATAENI